MPRKLPVQQNQTQPAYLFLSSEGKKLSEDYGRALESASASHRFRDFSNLAPGLSGRPGMTQQDYDYFRPEEALPHKRRDILRACNKAYKQNGLIRNVIDLMGDFACQGIRLVHPNKRIEKFYRNWFKKVNGKDRSERFLNNLYRLGAVVIRKQTAKISLKAKEQLYKSYAASDINVSNIEDYVVEKREIPYKYVFIDPSVVSVVGGPLASFAQTPLYAIDLPIALKHLISNPSNSYEKKLIAELPKDIVKAAKSDSSVVLPPDKSFIYHYKKDDWEEWSSPIIYSILKNISTLNKLELADNAALDGAISNIRIFKLGSFEHKIMPGSAAFSKLAELLQNNTGVGTLDLIWGPDIELIESNTNVHQFLGSEKYKPTMEAIYAGLGIPPTLAGSGGTGTTNNFISLKTLIERLQYGREQLVSFWEKELTYIQRAMGFRFPASIEFDIMSFANEEAIIRLLIQLADRNLISQEDIHTVLKRDPEISRIRINREEKERNEEKMPPKAGPFHDPQFKQALKKIALQSGIVTPSEVGLELQPKKRGEKTGVEIKKQEQKKKGELGQGRPPGTKDQQKRKEKEFTPKSKAVMELWASSAQSKISEILNPGLLAHFNKKNFRSLSSQEAELAENIKFGVLSNMEPFSEINTDTIQSALNQESVEQPLMRQSASEWCSQLSSILKRQLTIDEMRKVQVCVYANYKGEVDG